METKHTKGEWFIQGKTLIKCGNEQVASANAILDECESNAKLIAAAPELLEALIDLTNQIKNEHCSEFMDEPFDKAINAINKATK